MTMRHTTITWEDPSIATAQMPHLTGLEYMQQVVDGTLPGAPIGQHLNMEFTEASYGSVTFICHPDESHYNWIGSVHGGLMATVLDSALGCAAQTTLPAGYGYTTIDITVNFLRPVTQTSGPLTCVGTVVKPGRRITFAEGKIHDAAGKLVATATGSLLVFPLPTEE